MELPLLSRKKLRKLKKVTRLIAQVRVLISV
jgi:hypothetical protein